MKTVIAGLEEGLNAIAEALEGGGGGGGSVPTPTLDDDGKVLKVVSQSQEEVAPEWATVREVPAGGRNGQVLTKDSEGYGWATPATEIPSVEENYGKFLQAGSIDDDVPVQWNTIRQVPSGGTTGQVLTRTSGSGYGWANASGGGGNIDVLKISVDKSEFSPDEGNSGYYVAGIMTPIPNAVTKINNMISISIVDNVDSGYPSFTTPASDNECSIYYDDMVTIKINSNIYQTLGTRQATHFYLTYYTGA